MVDLASDCFRFVTEYFEIISASSPHIYHSALLLAPKKSIVRELYGSQVDPFVRIVHGALVSWDTHAAARVYHSMIDEVTWSPCDRFIAVNCHDTMMVYILDSVTFQCLQTLKIPEYPNNEHITLIFSPDSHILTCSISCTYGFGSIQGLFIISWDLQTGGMASQVFPPTLRQSHIYGKPSIVFSTNGRTAGIVFHQHSSSGYSKETIAISIFDVASGVCVYSHLLEDYTLTSNNAWAQGDSLQFATSDGGVVTIWQVGFASSAPPTKLKILPALGIPSNMYSNDLAVQFSPISGRLALAFQGGVLVWDVYNSKYLLHCTDTKFGLGLFFSSDGHSLACSTAESDIYLWKNSPTGFILHRTLTPSTAYPKPLLSQNCKSIVTYGGRTIQLWHGTEGYPTTPPSTLTQAPQHIGGFILDFSPDSMLAAFAIQKDNVATVFNLNSGVLQSTIDAGMEIYGLGMIKNTAVVIGSCKVGTWYLPVGDGTPGAKAGLEDCSWTIDLCGAKLHRDVISASISPDSHHIALTVLDGDPGHLYTYHTSTGGMLAKASTMGRIPRFSLDGLNICCADGDSLAWAEGIYIWTFKLDCSETDFRSVKYLPEGSPWGSTSGYQIGDDWWIHGPDGKRLLMLPPPWRPEPVCRLWKGQFLALLHQEIPEPVILELL